MSNGRKSTEQKSIFSPIARNWTKSRKKSIIILAVLLRGNAPYSRGKITAERGHKPAEGRARVWHTV
ncbi:hypothetical protein DWY69_22380 [Eisenbergiella massiliensis]|uniref:Uncharacterized protein n=1 Tax=Eisenbergiella massiliensis TaxID=1720294 RepID=A0A3E3IK89_9FIRM|nr:hypothetical protein DWY69_22380 [Eisenbergiella massiliensis]